MIKINYSKPTAKPKVITTAEMKDGRAYINVLDINSEYPTIYIANRLALKGLAAVSLCGNIVLELHPTGDLFVPVDIEVNYLGVSKSE